jgi:o-succinylbenzoate synthase
MIVSYAPFERALALPFLYGNQEIKTRSGICLRFEGEGGTFFSEASPLPGHSRENTAEVLAALLKLNSEYCSAIVTDDDDPADFFPPSLTFALESLRALRACKNKGGLAVRSNALVPSGGMDAMLERIWALKAEGFSTVKLKVLEGKTNDMLSLLAAIEGKGIQVRLDANRALSEGSLKSFFAGLEKFSPALIDYLEEPFAHWRHPLLERSPVALAADECAADPRFWPAILNQKTGPSVFVLKPTVSGGLYSLTEKALTLKEAGKRVVYTSALEAEPGRRALIAYLSSAELTATAGLATGFLFRENYLPDRPSWETVPDPSAAELSWLNDLPWVRVP